MNAWLSLETPKGAVYLCIYAFTDVCMYSFIYVLMCEYMFCSQGQGCERLAFARDKWGGIYIYLYINAFTDVCMYSFMYVLMYEYMFCSQGQGCERLAIARDTEGGGDHTPLGQNGDHSGVVRFSVTGKNIDR